LDWCSTPSEGFDQHFLGNENEIAFTRREAVTTPIRKSEKETNVNG